MTQKRKAELQRKLSMAPVAKPPSGLAERIKSDIPEYLRPQRDRERFSQSMAFSLRVAASIILLVTSVFLTMEMISRDKDAPVGITLTDAVKPAAQAPPPPPPQEMPQNLAAMKDAAETQTEAPVTMAGERAGAKEERRARQSDVLPRRAVATPAPLAIEQQKVAEGDRATIGGVTGTVVRDHALAESVQVTTAPAAVAPSAPEPPPAVANDMRVEAPPSLAGASSAPLAGATRMQRTAFASSETTEPFGISTDPSVVDKLKKIIGRGDAPPKNVDVAAVVNHFAGTSSDAVGDVRLQVEASRAPLKTDGTAIIRYTIDTPANLMSAEVSIVLHKEVIASYRTIGGAPLPEASTGSLRAGQSATGLVEVKIKPDTPEGERIARVILRYLSPTTQRTVQVTREVRAENLGQSWSEASRRHRLATLSAAWGESLSSANRQEELARTAEELAREAPKDPLAQELAAVIASSRPRSSAPTGSGG